MLSKVSFKLVYEVAKWEFFRWFKIKEHIITILASIILSFLFFGGKAIVEHYNNKNINIVLYNSTSLILKTDLKEKIVFKTIKSPINNQISLLKAKKIDGVLIIKEIGNYQLILNKEPSWLNDLTRLINAAHTKVKIKESNISAARLNEIFKQPIVNLQFTESKSIKSTTAEKVTAGIFIGIMLVGIFMGLAYQFVAITGEKQLRITEVIVSAITPQTWIDGKIIGVSLLSFALMITYVFSSLSFVLISVLFGSNWNIPISVANPGLVIILFIISICGLLFWNTFFSAIAATINDPNTSARGSLIMVPLIPIVIAFMALGNPDSLIMKILSVLPITSPPILAVRLVVTDVPFYEVFIAIFLLWLSIWYLRKAAGKIFAVSILMYGKELTWKEITKWVKA
ncbi:MAG: ABC transporter permease [bacterium]